MLVKSHEILDSGSFTIDNNTFHWEVSLFNGWYIALSINRPSPVRDRETYAIGDGEAWAKQTLDEWRADMLMYEQRVANGDSFWKSSAESLHKSLNPGQ